MDKRPRAGAEPDRIFAKIGNGNIISHHASTVKVLRSSFNVPGTVEIAERTYRTFGVHAVRN